MGLFVVEGGYDIVVVGDVKEDDRFSEGEIKITHSPSELVDVRFSF